jgi:hypothetical protein
MKDFIKLIKDSYWFTNESPFRLHYVETDSKVCIITGQNASGKSFLRKILNARHQDDNIEYIHLSQCGRSSSSGLMRAMIYGSEEEDSTGYISVKAIRGAIRTGTARTKPFALMLDEPEIGCSEELALSLSHKLVNEIPNMLKLETLYINTHSRNIVNPLLALNPGYVHLYSADDELKYPTIQSWLEREIEPIDVDLLYENANKKYTAVSKLIDNRKKS